MRRCCEMLGQKSSLSDNLQRNQSQTGSILPTLLYLIHPGQLFEGPFQKRDLLFSAAGYC